MAYTYYYCAAGDGANARIGLESESTTGATTNTSTFQYVLQVGVDPDGTSGLVSASVYNGSTQLASGKKLCTAGGAYQTISSGTISIPHNANGSGTFSLVLNITAPSGATNSLSQSITLTTIERRASISLSGNKNLGASETISVTRLFSGSKVKLLLKTGASPNMQVAALSSGDLSAYWQKYFGQFMTSMTQAATAYLYTYDASDSLVGYKTYSVNLVIPSDAYTLSATASCTASAYGAYIQNRSGGVFSVSATLGGDYDSYGTTYNKIVISVDGMSGQVSGQSGTWTSGNFSSSGSITATITAYDNHGKTATTTLPLSVTAYSFPVISAFSAVRDGSNNVSYSFTLNKSCSWAFSGISSLSGTASSGSGSFTFSGASSGTLTLTISDSYGGSAATAITISTSGCFIDFKNVNGTKSTCVGDFVDDTPGAEHEGFDVAVPVYCRNDGTNGFGDAFVKFGTSGIWNYFKLAGGLAIAIGKLSTTSSYCGAWGSVYQVLMANSNQAFPSGLFVEIPQVFVNKGAPSSNIGGVMYLQSSTSISSTGEVGLIRPSTLATGSAVQIDYLAIGRWK